MLQIGNVVPSSLFSRPLPKIQRGIRFEDIEKLEDAMAEQVPMSEPGCLATGIQKLPTRCRSVIEHKGHYFEGF